MPIEYTYDEVNNVLYTRFYGVVVDSDLQDQGNAVGADIRVKPGMRELVDLSGVEEIKASVSGLERNIQIDSRHREKLAGMRTAVVAQTDLLYGFARMFQALSELRDAPATVEVFRTDAEARKWLGLEDDEG
jgi:hypothetical protein